MMSASISKTAVLDQTRSHVRSLLEGEGSGHDWWHIHRVNQLALRIGEAEGADLYVVELAALLHDIGDHKFHNGDHTVGPRMAREWLEPLEVDSAIIDHVAEIIADLSFKGADVATPMRTLEGKVVQDADRLDAIGAIGIGRTFAYGGHKGQPMYDPDLQPVRHTSFEAYKSSKGTTINHFYEKLFLLKDRMNTPAAKALAQERHNYMQSFVQTFLAEWEGLTE